MDFVALVRALASVARLFVRRIPQRPFEEKHQRPVLNQVDCFSRSNALIFIIVCLEPAEKTNCKLTPNQLRMVIGPV